MGCLFWAQGEEFEVDAFLISSSLLPDNVLHRGESPLTKHPERKYPRSGFMIEVSETWGDLKPQIVDAIEFLKENELELSRLSTYPGVTKLCLDFPYERRKGAVTQTDSLPAELLLLAGQLGIAIDMTLYPATGEETL
jgi:hypothetical protein